MEKLFSAQKYIDRRNALKKKISSGIVLLPGNTHTPYNYSSNPYPFRQDSSFLYFFGINAPSLIGVIDVDSGKEYLFAPAHTTDDLIWEGPVRSFNLRAQRVGVLNTDAPEKCEQLITEAQKQNRKIHFLPPYRSEATLWLMQMLNLSKNEVKAAASEQLIKAVITLRTKKDTDEIAEIENTLNAVTFHVHTNAIRMAQPGIKETDIMAMVENIGLTNKARPAYPVICTINGQYLHNESYNNTLKEGQLLLLDAGIESPMHYATDITRTFPVSKQFTQQQKEIYQLTLDMQQTAFSLMKPGVAYSYVHQKVSETLATGLVSLGLMQGSPQEIVEKGAHALFFPHGLGHLMGLDVHDMENLGESYTGYDEQHIRSELFGTQNLRFGKKLLEGITITVEPGIYFIPALIELWQKEKKFDEHINYMNIAPYLHFGGIRIEDNILITNSGNRILGDPIPKTIKDIEDIKVMY